MDQRSPLRDASSVECSGTFATGGYVMDRKQLVIGLPAAGKTTFLAALWHVLESGRVPGALRVSEVHGDQGYLNRIRDAWGSCEPIERTRRGQEAVVRMRLVEADGSAATELVVPDPSGESFSDQWELGRATSDYQELAARAVGVLLFINPTTVDTAPVIEPAATTAVEADPAAGRPWQPQGAGTQVQLVEMLQALRRPPFGVTHCPVSVLVSAWDRLVGRDVPPNHWLAQTLPLLHQYLWTNEETFPSRVFGVSAQGGDLDTQREELLAKVEPWERVLVVGPECEPHDLSAPVRWVMRAP